MQLTAACKAYWLGSNGATTVGADDLPGDVGGGRHAEESDQQCDLLRLTHAVQGKPRHLRVQLQAAAADNAGPNCDRPAELKCLIKCNRHYMNTSVVLA